ncbi:MAG TPA: TIGR01777 family oxidoreductase [Acidimicrobiales bacterium]|nr:TIGR01777 family oxidoreductase [Acidimicrobiales bacterium]
MGTYAVTGASGFIGSALCESLLADGNEVVRFVRREPAAADEAGWDPGAGTMDLDALATADAVVHLAGEPLGDRRWTAAQKRRIEASRVQGTETVARAMARVASSGRRQSLVSGSAVGFYGLRGDEVLTEESGPGTGFLADVCRAWEAATAPAADAGVRVVLARTGIVLGASGAMGRMLPLFRLGLGGRLGSGRQWWSWVSLADAVGLLRLAADSPAIEGPMNATAPEPATNAEITRALARALRRPAVLPVPQFALSIVMGREMTAEMVMAGQRALPEVAERAGHRFEHRTVDEGMRAAVGR